MFPVVIAHHNTLMREDNKIENQNKKVQAAHDTLIEIKEKVDSLTAAGNSTTPSNMLSKATKSLEKSNEAFEKGSGWSYVVGWNGVWQDSLAVTCGGCGVTVGN